MNYTPKYDVISETRHVIKKQRLRPSTVIKTWNSNSHNLHSSIFQNTDICYIEYTLRSCNNRDMQESAGIGASRNRRQQEKESAGTGVSRNKCQQEQQEQAPAGTDVSRNRHQQEQASAETGVGRNRRRQKQASAETGVSRKRRQ